MTKGLKSTTGTPLTHRKVRPEDGHRDDSKVPTRQKQPVQDSAAYETEVEQQARRLREGGKD